MKELNVVLTHFDLDGICSAIAGQRFLGEESFIQFPCSYNTLDKNIDKLIDEIDEREARVWIFDLSLEPKHVEKIIATNAKSILHCDHHPLSVEMSSWLENVSEHHPRYRLMHDIDKAGALITYEALSKIYSKKYPEIEYLCRIADAYDRWQKDSELFKLGVELNILFWELGYTDFFKYEKNGYRIGTHAKKLVDEKESKTKQTVEKLLAEDSFFVDINGMRMAIVLNTEKSVVNDLTRIDDSGNDLYLIFTGVEKKGFKFSLRSKKSLGEKNFTILSDKLNQYVRGCEAGGHPEAAGIFINREDNDIKQAVEDILEVTRRYFEN